MSANDSPRPTGSLLLLVVRLASTSPRMGDGVSKRERELSNLICETIPPSRRDVLRIGRDALAAATPAVLLGLATPAAAQTGSQNQWRFCQKCFSLFFDGFAQSGVCPGGGEHRAYGWDFYLDYDANERNKQQQYSWRYCQRCFSLFWTGRDGHRGVCPATAGYHDFQGYHFGLYYTNETQTKPPSGGPYQANWRYCDRCHNLFYNGYKEKGRCPAAGDGTHNAYGWTFHLRYTTAPPKGKQPSGKPADRINTAFKSWLAANHISNASLAVMQSGSLLAKFGYGARGADARVPVASLSKAITAVCVSTLVDAGRLNYNDTIGMRLSDFLRAHPPADKNAISITVSQLLRHRSRIGYDPTQNKSYSNADSAQEAIVADALSKTLSSRSAGTFFYNNVNYSLLSLIVKEVSGTSYESYCRRILGARGASNAHIAAGLHAMGPFGGWEISAPEYLNFGRAFDRGQRMMSQSANTFLESDSYTLGVGYFKTAQGREFQHFGDWKANWTVPDQMGAYFGIWNNGISVCATYDRHIDNKQQNRLSATLRAASYGR